MQPDAAPHERSVPGLLAGGVQPDPRADAAPHPGLPHEPARGGAARLARARGPHRLRRPGPPGQPAPAPKRRRLPHPHHPQPPKPPGAVPALGASTPSRPLACPACTPTPRTRPKLRPPILAPPPPPRGANLVRVRGTNRTGTRLAHRCTNRTGTRSSTPE
jgi:hypothetical protein